MWYYILTFCIFWTDVVTKTLAAEWFQEVDTVPVIKDVFHLTYVENRGMAFGMLNGGRVIFVAVTILVLVALCIFLIKTPASKKTVWLKLGSAFVASGAIGNLVERIFKGYVVDFLDFRIIDFPVFNVADIAVCVGAVMLAIHFMKSEV